MRLGRRRRRRRVECDLCAWLCSAREGGGRLHVLSTAVARWSLERFTACPVTAHRGDINMRVDV